MSEQAVDVVTRVEAAGVPRARQVLELARWAGGAFSSYDLASVRRVCAASESVAGRSARSATDGVTTSPDFVSPRVDIDRRGDRRGDGRGNAGIVLVPRPVGTVVVMAASGSVDWLPGVVLAALTARDAVVVVPDLSAPRDVLERARAMGAAAESAGAPTGVVQVVDHPSDAVVDAVTTDPRAALVLSPPTGWVPVIVDASADLRAAARHLLTDGGPEPSAGRRMVLVVDDTAADALVAALVAEGASYPVLLDSVVSLDAVAPVDVDASLVMVRVCGHRRALRAAAAVLRIGAGDTVVVHTGDPAAALAFAAALPVSHVVVNDVLSAVPLVNPDRLVTWTRVQVGGGGAAALAAYAQEEVSPWRAHDGPVPPYPVASNAEGASR